MLKRILSTLAVTRALIGGGVYAYLRSARRISFEITFQLKVLLKLH